MVDDRAADAAYLAMASHFDDCEECARAGAELASLAALCETGRSAIERWLHEDFRSAWAAEARARYRNPRPTC